MLKQIIFLLKSDKSPYMRSIVADINYLNEKFRENGVEVSYLLGDGIGELVLADDQGRSSLQGSSVERQNTLFLADDAQTLNKMLEAGFYTIALQHDLNNRADLQQALYAMSEIRYLDFDSFLKAYERLAGLPWHILDTKRLTVRETTIEDVDDFYRIYKDPLITQHMAPMMEIDKEREYAAEYIRTIYNFYGHGIWTVTLKETGEVIGRAGISWREGFRYPELGFVIARDHQCKGYAEEVLRAILELAKNVLEFDVVQALIHPENIVSMKLCKKLGFKEEGVVCLREQEHLLYIIEL